MYYLIQKESFRGAARWNLSRVFEDGSSCALGHYATRRAAATAASLLAGWRGRVVYGRPIAA